MKHVSDAELRQNLAHHLDATTESHAPLLVTRENGKASLVIMSEEDFSSWQETAFLLGSPANADWLLSSIKAADAGEVFTRELTRPDTSA